MPLNCRFMLSSCRARGLSRFLCQPRGTVPFSGRRFASLPENRDSPHTGHSTIRRRELGKLFRRRKEKGSWGAESGLPPTLEIAILAGR